MNLPEAEQLLKRTIDNAPLSTTERLAARDALGLFIENINRLGSQVDKLDKLIRKEDGGVSTG